MDRHSDDGDGDNVACKHLGSVLDLVDHADSRRIIAGLRSKRYAEDEEKSD